MILKLHNKNSLFENNNATHDLKYDLPDVLKNSKTAGGAIYIVGHDINVTSSNFTDNHANAKYGNTSKSGKNEIYVDFDENLVKYTTKDFASIKHGFIISIHKSQGSEFEIVIMPITRAYNRMLYKKLVYTAVTRAKRRLIIIGEPDAFLTSVYNNNEYARNSKLLDKLRYKFENS